MENKSWLYAVLIVAAPASFSAISPVVKGEPIVPRQIRRSYALSGIFIIGAGVAVSALAKDATPLLASVGILAANIAAQEWAIALQSVERGRE